MYDRQEIASMSRTITRLTLPVLIEQFFIVSMGAINTMLVSNIGGEAISATGNVDTINNIIISVFSALAVGGTVVVAQYTGREDDRKANQAAAQALLACFLIAGSVTALIGILQRPLLQALFQNADPLILGYSYTYLAIILWSYVPIGLMTMAFGILRGSGDTRIPMIISIIMNLVNVGLSYVLIYGIRLNAGILVIQTPALGVRGAAIGLTAARTLGMVLALFPLLRGDRQIKLDWHDWLKLDGPMLRSILHLGVPGGTEQLMFNGGKLIVQTFIVQLGTIALASNAICNSLAAMATIPGLSMSLAITALVGQAVGRGDKTGARKLLTFSVLYNSVALAALSLLFLPFARALVGLFTHDPTTIRTAVRILYTYLLAQPLFWSGSFALPSGLRGAGDVRYTMIISIISMWLLRILLGYLFAIVLDFGLLGVWLAMYADWAFRAVQFILRLRSGKWLQHRTVH